MRKRFILLIGVSILLVAVSVLPAFAAATTCTVNMADTFNMTSTIAVKTIDGEVQSHVTTATLIIADNTVTTKGVITNATLAVPGYVTVAVTGYIGHGNNPYLTLYGASSDVQFILTGKVHAHAAVPQSITGRIDGFGTHSQAALGDDPAGAVATWSTASQYDGTTSALLTQAAAAGSTYVQFVPAGTFHLRDLDTISSGWSIWHNTSAVAGGPQVELRFQKQGYPDPDGVGHVDITLLPHQGVGNAVWEVENLTSATKAIYYGNDPYNGTAFDESSGALTLAQVEAAINEEAAMSADGTVYTCGDWHLIRVRIELWEAGARTSYIDSVTINNRFYSFEPVVFSGSFKAVP